MSQKLQVAVAGIGRMGMDLPLGNRKKKSVNAIGPF